MIKTINTHEKVTLLEDLVPVMKERQSLLVRVYGVFMLCVGSYSINLIVMENILHNSPSPHFKFDLKGSRYRRRVMCKGQPLLDTQRKVLKDVDFEETLGSLRIPRRESQKLFSKLSKDVKALERLGIMDYSLFVSVARGQTEAARKSKYFFSKEGSDNEFYMIALIDFLQKFDLTKQVEGVIKRVFKRVPAEELSAVEPRLYARRFLECVSRIALI